MAHTPARKADADDVLPSGPKNRDQLVQENRRRDNRPHEPQRDLRAQPDSDLIPEARTKPATTPVVNQDQNPDASGTPLRADDRAKPGTPPTEVRAGPGDAGKQDSPNLLAKSQNQGNGRRRAAVTLLGVGLGIVIVMILLAIV